MQETAVDEVNIFTHSQTTMDEVGMDVPKAHITVNAIRSHLYQAKVDPNKDIWANNTKQVLDIW